MDEEELSKILKNHEDRISKIEEIVFKKKVTITYKHKGLSGGIQLLIENGFLNNPKTVSEISDELKREGYFGDKKSVDKLLRIDYLQKRVLTRIKIDKIWGYAVRK
ncbi:MAG: hypothetical protein NT130_04580 [Candidatus Micrarchaeota archaeon]|nr:hypothetical protein [Candidatus Micrarchaeota archaeon]